MATPKRSAGYVFDPESGATVDEVMICLETCVRLLSGNSVLTLAPCEVIEQLPKQARRHFRKVAM